MSWLFAHVVGHQFLPRRTKASLLGWTLLPRWGPHLPNCFPRYLLLLVERRRRFNINDRIKELGMLIPKANDL